MQCIYIDDVLFARLSRTVCPGVSNHTWRPGGFVYFTSVNLRVLCNILSFMLSLYVVCDTALCCFMLYAYRHWNGLTHGCDIAEFWYYFLILNVIDASLITAEFCVDCFFSGEPGERVDYLVIGSLSPWIDVNCPIIAVHFVVIMQGML